KRLVASGLGIGLLFRSVIDREVAEGRLVPLDQFELSPKLSFWLAVRPALRELPLLVDFSNMLRATAHGAARMTPARLLRT
ncbi:MAG TPA: LysR substrate-binding domain-containing protein, partial [Chloroflexota bacterium]|nr:LysR substrate-binding domain-containing protein [Chloroflexota bacterium]